MNTASRAPSPTFHRRAIMDLFHTLYNGDGAMDALASSSSSSLSSSSASQERQTWAYPPAANGLWDDDQDGPVAAESGSGDDGESEGASDSASDDSASDADDDEDEGEYGLEYDYTYDGAPPPVDAGGLGNDDSVASFMTGQEAQRRSRRTSSVSSSFPAAALQGVRRRGGGPLESAAPSNRGSGGKSTRKSRRKAKGPAVDEATRRRRRIERVVQAYYDPNAGTSVGLSLSSARMKLIWRAVFENPLVRAQGAHEIASHFALAAGTAVPARYWSELVDVCESESYDGMRLVHVSHVLHVSLLPGLVPSSQGSPYHNGHAAAAAGAHTQHSPQTPYNTLWSAGPSTPYWHASQMPADDEQGGSMSRTRRSASVSSVSFFLRSSHIPPTSATSSASTEPPPPQQQQASPASRTSLASPSQWPIGLVLASLRPSAVLASATSFHIKVQSSIIFNEVGMVVAHEDTYGVRELLESWLPIAREAYRVQRRVLGAAISYVGSALASSAEASQVIQQQRQEERRPPPPSLFSTASWLVSRVSPFSSAPAAEPPRKKTTRARRRRSITAAADAPAPPQPAQPTRGLVSSIFSAVYTRAARFAGLSSPAAGVVVAPSPSPKSAPVTASNLDAQAQQQRRFQQYHHAVARHHRNASPSPSPAPAPASTTPAPDPALDSLSNSLGLKLDDDEQRVQQRKYHHHHRRHSTQQQQQQQQQAYRPQPPAATKDDDERHPPPHTLLTHDSDEGSAD